MELRIQARDYNFKGVLAFAEREKQRVDKATVKALSRFGAILRQDARKRIGTPVKKQKPVAEVWSYGKKHTIYSKPTPPRPPGKAPRARSYDEFNTLRNIRWIPYFRRSVIRVGVWETGVKYKGGLSGAEMHEFGLTFRTKVFYARTDLTLENTMSRKGQRRIKSQRLAIVESKKYGKPVTFKMPKRPIMRPPFDKHKNNMTQIWIDYYKAGGK